eukprot:TRINITY_DN3337_c0_g1_i1.p1 TRINITY_DN3337_c0_g1~~TRINITY_DN3337_c0_g1_i1.p1  ORF type:complete len:402 (+),score=63.27 TRINITY_DN3337_c0_g1_i1:74-1279(+)
MKPFIALLSVLLAHQAVLGEPIPLDGRIRRSSKGFSYAYVVPPEGSNHASTIQTLPDGSVLLAWFTGGEGHPNCSIAFSRLLAHSDAWPEGRVVSERIGYSNQNPVLFYDSPRRTLRLFHASRLPAGEYTSVLMSLHSEDFGQTWSRPLTFYDVPGAFTKNTVVPVHSAAASATAADGVVLLPCYNSTRTIDHSFVLIGTPSPSAHAAVGDSSGYTWQRAEFPMSWDLIQPTVVPVSAAAVTSPHTAPAELRLRAWFRDEDKLSINVADGVVRTSGGSDGATAVVFDLPRRTVLPSDGSGIQALQLASGRVVMLLDLASEGSGDRTPLVALTSDDNGETWPYCRTLQHTDDNSTILGRYSYPSLTQGSDGTVHMAFTYDRLCIKYVATTEEWLASGRDCQV